MDVATLRSVNPALKIPRRWTYRETAKLLGIGRRSLTYLIAHGQILGHVDTWYTRPPGAPRALRRQRGYVSSMELVRYMQTLEAQAPARPRQVPRLPCGHPCPVCRPDSLQFDSSST